MITKEEQLLTNKLIYGKWYHKDERNVEKTIEYTLNIDPQITQFIVKVNGEITINDEFKSNPIWIDRYLHYVDTHKYFIEKATETEIYFGQLTNLGTFDGKYKVHEVLKRVG